MIKAWWFRNEGENFGDAVCPMILEKLTGQNIVYSDESHSLASIGSVLFYQFSAPKVIWGSGAISSFHNSSIVKQHDIRAVRGPLSRKRLNDMGIDCPEVYGDPSILLPLFYDQSKYEKKHEVSLLPHWVDYEYLKSNRYIAENFNIIDIRSGVENVMREILESNSIISSSLHGIIVPEAFGIKSYLCKFSDKVTGGLFKFKDYYNSTNRIVRCCDYSKGRNIDVDEVLNLYENSMPQLDSSGLLKAFPYEITNKKALELIGV